MKKIILAAVLAALGVVAGACNDVGDCPSTITPGGSCEGDNLSCPYVLQTPSVACDGTTVDGGVATSCVCQAGTWSCPSPFCSGDDAGTGDDGGSAGGEDAMVDAGD